MDRFFKIYAVPSFLIGLKIFIVLRTALDTLVYSGAFEPNVSMLNFISSVLYVVLIDSAMAAFWFYGSYAGDSQKAQALKLWALLATWALFLGQMWIGIAAHTDSPVLAVLARVAGGFALSFDSYAYVVGPVKSTFVKIGNWTKKRFRRETPEEAYSKLFDKELLKSLKQSSPEIRTIVEENVRERILLELPKYVLNALPFPEEMSGNSSEENRPRKEVRPMRASSAIARAWESCRTTLVPNEMFRREDIEACTELGKSRASEIINYAISLNEVERWAHGVYLFHPVLETPVIDQPPSEESPEQSDAKRGGHTSF